MKHLLKTIALTVFSAALVACKGTPKNEAANETPAETKNEASKPPRPQPLTIQDETLNAIFPHYGQLTEALIAGKLAEAKIVASTIEAGASGGKGSPSLKRFASQIVSAPSLDVQRKAYGKLSEAMAALVKKAGVKNGSLYVTYCPMANENEGAYWLNPSREIRNPYMGEKMLTCGEVKETLQ